MSRTMLARIAIGAAALSSVTAFSAAMAQSYSVPLETPMAGFYVTAQGGYAMPHMKDKLTDFMKPLKLTTVGGTGAKGDPAANEALASEIAKKLDTQGIAGRLGLGYQFHPNGAIEAGALYLGRSKIKKDDEITFKQDKKDETWKASEDITLTQYSFDVVGKGILPLGEGLSAYGKLGAAFVNTDFQTDIKAKDKDDKEVSLKDAFPIKNQWAPEVAVGLNYEVAPNMVADLSWTHIHPMGDKDKQAERPGNIDLFAVGIGYYFG
jgi:opacity protein-like surface antigen